jgi:hypothetical protein
MQPLHFIEYEMTSELAAEIERSLVRWELRRGWRRDAPTFAAALVFAMIIIGAGLQGWMLPTVSGGLLCLLTFFMMGAVLRRLSSSRAAAGMALLPLQTSDRRVRVDFGEDRMCLEAEFFRGEGAWNELDNVVIFDRFWVLQLSNGGQIVLPVSALTPDLEAFIRAKAGVVEAPIKRG